MSNRTQQIPLDSTKGIIAEVSISPSPKPSVSSVPLTIERATVEVLQPLPIKGLFTIMLVLLIIAVGVFLCRCIFHTIIFFNEPLNLIVPGILSLAENEVKETLHDYDEEIDLLLDEQDAIKKNMDEQRDALNEVIRRLDSIGVLRADISPMGPEPVILPIPHENPDSLTTT